MIGATYKFNPNLTVYGGYSESNRAPTPLELGCSSPTNPCIIDNFLIADPPLKQVVSHTYEAGCGASAPHVKTGQLTGPPGAAVPLGDHQRRRNAADDRLLQERGRHLA